jgi:Fe-S oxidoreductase
LGGPSSCCGVIHSKWEGDLKKGGQITEGSLQKFGNYQPKQVLNWCPSCELHLGETVKGYREMSFDFDHITKYLVESENKLVAKFVAPVEMKVMLHAHEGMTQLGDNVQRLMELIPGLTIVDVVREGGYTCGGSGVDRSPGLKAKGREETIRRAIELKVDAVVSLYHGCHMQLSNDGREHGFQVINFTDLLVRALGGEPRTDALESLSALNDWQQIALQASPSLIENGIHIDPNTLASLLPEIFSLAEFRGGLQNFVSSK